LAAELGIERSNIGKYEGKSRVIPSTDVLSAIADYFNVSTDYLLGRTSTPTPSIPPVSDDAIRFALFDGAGEITDEMYEDVKRYAAFIREREKPRDAVEQS
jgi:transcriptional regulator with XRE-family HTH domain